MDNFKFKVNGLEATLEVFDSLRDEIGDANSRSRILNPVVREAMKPVLAMAQSLAPVDTGLLKESLTIYSRRPTGKDKQSRYIGPKDAAIAVVSTRPIPRRLKKEAKELTRGITDSKQRAKMMRSFYESQNIFYDARAIANEFGTKNRSPHPFLRVSLESQAQTVSDYLGQLLKQKIESYKAKNSIT